MFLSSIGVSRHEFYEMFCTMGVSTVGEYLEYINLRLSLDITLKFATSCRWRRTMYKPTKENYSNKMEGVRDSFLLYSVWDLQNTHQTGAWNFVVFNIKLKILAMIAFRAETISL